MANRSYLYSANKDLTKFRDLSEWRSEIPLFHKIVSGCDTQICNSKIWDYEHPIAIRSDFSKGLQKFLSFLDYLATQPGMNAEKITAIRQETTTFFDQHPERVQDLFFLEGGEVFDLIGDLEPIEQQNRSLFEEINIISRDIDDILQHKPANVFEYKSSAWLQGLQKDIEQISVYWTYVTYFSFNKS